MGPRTKLAVNKKIKFYNGLAQHTKLLSSDGRLKNVIFM